MAPTAKIERKQPGTLPADFGEWDSGDTPATLPDDFEGFDVARRASVVEKQAVPGTRDRASSRTSEDRADRPKPPARVNGRAADTKIESSIQINEPAPLSILAAQAKSTHKGKVPLIAAGSVLILLVTASLWYFRAQPKRAPEKQSVAVQIQAPQQAIAKPSPMTPVSPAAPAVGNQAADETTPAPRIEPATMDSQLNAPSRISRDIKSVGEQQAPGLSAAAMEGMGGTSGEMVSGVFRSKGMPVVKTEPRVTNISAGIAKGLLLRQTPPTYPTLAKSAHVSGTVVLKATISKTGAIEDLHVVSGSQMLRQAAIEAVKTWRYKPYMLNNQPVEIDTTVDVIFSLGK